MLFPYTSPVIYSILRLLNYLGNLTTTNISILLLLGAYFLVQSV
jgi:uncharacterized membrane protein